jgi:hypothetical protein
MIGYFLFIVLFVFSKDNHCYDQLNAHCEKIVNSHTPYDSPDFNQVIGPDTFPEKTPDFIPLVEPTLLPEETPDNEIIQSNDFETADLPTVYLQDLEHGILVKAYDLRFSLFAENNTYVHDENNSITIEMKPNNFIFQIYS